jgi:hypothetical protein
MDSANIYQKILEIFGKAPDNLSVLEEQIDISRQMEYFEFGRKNRNNLNFEEILNNRLKLFDTDLPLESKKILLVQLASIDKVEAFRAIEQYLESPDPELKDWAILACQESKMLIESLLLDETKIFISTGLGGKGTKLRYFVLMTTQTGEKLTESQKNLVNIEFDTYLTKYGAEIEQINFADEFFTLVLLIPINISIKDAFKKAIEECNQYGNFLTTNFIVSNIKVWSVEEIKDFMSKQNK